MRTRPNFSPSRRRALLALAALGAPAALTWAQADPAAAAPAYWPSKPVKLLVAYPPGGVSDTVGRALAERLATRLGVPVVVENKAGASGMIGVDAAAKAPPDGYTLVLAATSPLTLSPQLVKAPYDPLKDLVAVAPVMTSPVLLLATSAAPEGDLKTLLARARDGRQPLRWATSGSGSVGHVMLESVKAAAKTEIVHVPYKGGGQPLQDAVAGHFELLSTNAASAVTQQIKAGKLRPLAVGAPERLAHFPQVPTLAELGFPAANLASTFAVFGPAGLSPSAQSRLEMEIHWVLAGPQMRERLAAAETVMLRLSAAQLQAQVVQEAELMARVVREARIKAD
jgi:tripartite-type tricarboxylate transporter receptor subunit TctC